MTKSLLRIKSNAKKHFCLLHDPTIIEPEGFNGWYFYYLWSYFMHLLLSYNQKSRSLFVQWAPELTKNMHHFFEPYSPCIQITKQHLQWQGCCNIKHIEKSLLLGSSSSISALFKCRGRQGFKPSLLRWCAQLPL
jgi:hypothetical protein